MPSPAPAYVPLQVLGHHSLLRGTFSPKALVAACARYGIDTCALTDRNSLMGVVPFIQAARAAGIRPLVGVDLEQRGLRLTVLAKNRQGHAACCELVSLLHLEPGRDLLREVARRGADLEVLCCDPQQLARVHGALEGRHLHAALVRVPGHRPERLRRVAQELGVPCVAAGDVHFLERSRHAVHRVLRAIGETSVVDRLPEGACAPPEACLLAPRAMAARHQGEEELLDATRALAERCAVDLDFGKPVFPHVEVPGGHAAASYLARLARAGAEQRYGSPLPARVRDRVHAELAVIEELGFADYFLIVREILDFARSERIPFVGRGSAADSLVVYCLGFTRVDPFEHDLVFERFLSRSRRSLPDIDVDFCWRRRDAVIAWIYRRFGKDRVATICTHTTLRFRSAFREAARALGMPPPLVDRTSKALPYGFEGSVAEAIERFPECRAAARDERLRRVLRVAEALRGMPRHLGMHPGGMVIADRRLTWYTPLVRSAKGPLVTQMEMRAIEALGLVKMDILGQRSLSTIGDTLELLEEAGEEVPDLEALPGEDRRVRALLNQGRTLGCFQVESPGMRKLVVEMRAQSRRNVIDAVALIRPGAAGSGMKDHYIRRARGLEEVTVPHPALEPVLRRSFGVMLYQEDILRVCAAVAGWTLEEGDLLRNALGKKKDPQLTAELERRYRAAAGRHGVPPEAAEEVWQMVGNFAAFSYCKAHAATYGTLAFEELWLKSRHPAAFFCAVLNNHRGYYPDRVYVEEALRCGARFRLPDVNRSERLFTLERGAIRIGLERVRSLSRATLERLLEERAAGGPYLSLSDLFERARPDVREARHLVFAGALDAFDRPRPELLWRLELLAKERLPRRPAPGDLFDSAPPDRVLPRIPDYPERKKRRLEYAVLGLTAEGGGPLFGVPAQHPETVEARALPELLGRTVTCFGWCSATRRTRTSRGDYMRFITLEDPTGTIEGVFFPDSYLRFGHLVRGDGPYFLTGRVEAEHGAVTVHVTGFRRLDDEPDPATTHAETESGYHSNSGHAGK